MFALANSRGVATELGLGVSLSENVNSGAPSLAALLLRTSRHVTNINHQSCLSASNEGMNVSEHGYGCPGSLSTPSTSLVGLQLLGWDFSAQSRIASYTDGNAKHADALM